MSVFVRKSTKNDENPERVIAVPESDYEAALREDDDFEEISVEQLKSQLGDEDFEKLPEAIKLDAQPAEHPKAPRVASKPKPQSSSTEG